MLEHILVHAEFTGTSEVHSHVRTDDALHLSNPIVERLRPIIHQLAPAQVLFAPCPAMKRRNHREQLKPI